MAKWGGEARGDRKGLFPRERAVERPPSEMPTQNVPYQNSENGESRLLDSLVAAILLLADGERERAEGVAEEEEKNGRFIVRFGRRAHPLFLRKFLGGRRSSLRPSEAITKKTKRHRRRKTSEGGRDE